MLQSDIAGIWFGEGQWHLWEVVLLMAWYRQAILHAALCKLMSLLAPGHARTGKIQVKAHPPLPLLS